jgi:glycosyltransferase involved in cell wall biosynthesis
MNLKKVSVIVPCYNQAQFLDEALNSALDQSYVDWECIIIDDGSPDNTKEVALRWCNEDKRFIYLKKDNAGLSAARNTGIEIAKGVFILPLDADDKIAKKYIEHAVQSFIEDTSLKVVYCKAEKFGDEDGLWDLPQFSLFNLSRNNLIFPSGMYRKADWQAVGGYDSKMIYGWEDWEFWIALLKNGGNVKQLKEVGFYYRIKSVSMLKQIDQEKGNYLLNYLSVKHADFFVNHYGSFASMNRALIEEKNEQEHKLKSEKFAIDVFCSVFFGFSIFGKYRKPKNN